MKINRYTTATFEAGDYVFGLKNGDPKYTRLFGNIQTTESGMTPETTIQVVMNRTQIQSSEPTYDDGFLLLSIPTGYSGAQLTKPPVLTIFQDGQGFVFQSGSDLIISGSDPNLGSISAFSDVVVTGSDGSYSGPFFSTYKIVGDLYVYATTPITGGGTNATFTFTLTYRLF